MTPMEVLGEVLTHDFSSNHKMKFKINQIVKKRKTLLSRPRPITKRRGR
jgi:hypothetical protein